MKGKRRRNIALFGGTFDPIHSGHMRIAEAAREEFALDEIYFILSAHPPHKGRRLTAFAHRYAMVALACAGRGCYLPSLVEAPVEGKKGGVSYSVETAGRFRRQFAGENLYFLLGADSFLEIGKWHKYEKLLECCDFIVASRPGFDGEGLRRALPARLLRAESGEEGKVIEMRKTKAHLLTAVESPVSSTEIRERRGAGLGIGGLTPRAVEEYIIKQRLYARER